MSDEQPNNPLHGVTLKAILEELVARYGWDGLAERIPIQCFKNDPGMKSSLNYLRKTHWARNKVEKLYLADAQRAERNRKRNQRRAERRRIRAAAEAAQEASDKAPDGSESGGDEA